MAAAIDYTEDLESELECPICKDIYKDPVEIKCGHNFCRRCLSQYTSAENKKSLSSVVPCPICRKSYQMDAATVKSMAGNLKLRNIISLVSDSLSSKCVQHSRPHTLYCLNCDDIKCFQCYSETCKAYHDTKEIDVITEDLRKSVKIKIDQCNSESDRTNEFIKECSELKANLNSLITATSNVEEILKFMKKLQKQKADTIKKKLEGLLSLSKRELVEKREEIKEIKCPEATDTDSVTTAVQLVVKEFKGTTTKSLEQLRVFIDDNTDILKENQDAVNADDTINAASEIAPTPSSPHTNPNTYGPSTGSREDPWSRDNPLRHLFDASSDFSDWVPHYLDPFISVSNMLYDGDDVDSDEFDIDDFMNDSPRSSVSYHSTPTSADFNSMVESVAYIAGKFYVSIDKGVKTICTDDNSTQRVLSRNDALACCALDRGKMLVSFKQSVALYIINDLDRGSIFTLPTTEYGQYTDLITSLGFAYCDDTVLYFLGDTANYCIHVWHAGSRVYRRSIDIKRYSDSRSPSFRMTVYNNRIFVSLYFEGQVLALDLRGNLLWRNTSFCEKPNGLFADSSGIYVCDAMPGIAVLYHNGQSKRRILENSNTSPAWSIAVGDDKLALVKRFYRHNVRRSRIQVKIFESH